jgi:spore germination cell wall hydrolase CwlJ-like protein
LRLPFRAAAFAAAAATVCVFDGFAAPSFATEAEAVPAVPYIAHAATGLTVDNLGLNELQDLVSPADGTAAAPAATQAIEPALPAVVQDEEREGRRGRSLGQMVDDYAASDTPDAETDCLARAVYYESKGEPLHGQLTVAEVILNRSTSGRFPSTICGVVRQRGQFSFVRGGSIPTPPQGSRDWRIAVAIARIAVADLADGGAPRALFFHARRVNPGWRLTRVATVGNHVFYR